MDGLFNGFLFFSSLTTLYAQFLTPGVVSSTPSSTAVMEQDSLENLNEKGFPSRPEAAFFGQSEATLVPTPVNSKGLISLKGASPDITFDITSNWWVRCYAGYDFSFLSDLINGTNAYVGQYGSGASASTGNSGIHSGLELGRSINKDNAISLDVESVWSQTDTVIYTSSGNTITQSVGPNLFSVSLNFYHYLERQKGDTAYLVVGAGYYHGSVNYLETETLYPGEPTAGTFTGDILGGTIGVGKAWSISDFFSIDVSVKGRYATFSQLTSQSIVDTGAYVNNYAPYALVINGTLGEGPTQFIAGNGSRYAVLDYSGFDGDVSLKLCF